MPRRNRPPQHRRPQHQTGKARPQGLHKKARSANVAKSIRWLEDISRSEGEAA